MTTKVIYFTVSGRHEQAEFSSDDAGENVREIFRAAAEANESDILKLYNVQGNLINISQRLAENTPDKRYKLEVVAAQYSGASVAAELGFDVGALDKRLETLEKKIMAQQCEAPEVVYDMKRKVDVLREKLENLDHLSWLGLYKDLSSGTSLQPFWNKFNHTAKSPEKCRQVFDKVNRLCQVQMTKEVRDYLKKPSFDNWQWDDAEMIMLLRQMFIDLGLVVKFNIELPILLEWLFEIYKHYNDVPFHNFKHCFMVAQMMFGLICLIDLPKKMDDLDILTLIVSAICHDLDHPGYNNAYQINARTELALRYNDISPLENHHCSIAFEILENKDCNILKNLEPDLFKRLREGMIKCILATDMAKHHEILKNFKSVTGMFDFAIKEHKDLFTQILIKVCDISNEARPLNVAVPWLECLLEEFFNQLFMILIKCSDLSNEVRPVEVSEPWLNCLLEEFFMQLMMILIKMADISNEVRPMEVADIWLECLFEEYFNQSDIEKLEGLPVAPFMDREKVTKPSSQIGFIKFVLLPLFEALGELFPIITEDIITPVQRALEYYTDMQQALEQEKKRKEEEREAAAAAAAVEGQTDAFHVVKLPDKHKFKVHTLTRSILHTSLEQQKEEQKKTPLDSGKALP